MISDYIQTKVSVSVYNQKYCNTKKKLIKKSVYNQII